MNTNGHEFRRSVAAALRAACSSSGLECGGLTPLSHRLGRKALSSQRTPKHAFGIRKSGFTLIELLAVVGIMALILVIALPAFDAFKLRGTQTAIPQINSTLRLARQYAITHRQDVYVVFPDGRSAYSPPGEVNKALCSYAVIASNRATGFEYVTEWKYLPKGVFFYPNTSISTASVFNSCGALNNLTSFPFPNDRDANRDLCAVKFRPNGRAYVLTKSKDSWTHFGYTWIPVTAGYVEVDTNAGRIISSPIVLSDTNIIKIANMTGQIYTETD